MPNIKKLLAGTAAMVWIGACAGKSAPTPSSEKSSSAGQARNELSAVTVEERGSSVAVVIAGSQVMSPNVFKLTDPDRIIVDLTSTALGSVTGPIDVNKGGIAQITLDQFDDASSSLSRVVINLTQPMDYKLEAEGTNLVVKVDAAGEGSSSDLALPAVPPAVGMPESPPSSATGPAEGLQPLSEGTEGAAPVAAPGPASATQLVDVQYAASEAGSTVTLVGNGSIEEYEDFVLAGPNRVVIDLKGVKNAYRGGKTISLGTPEVSKIRLGKSDGKLRVVLDTPGLTKPAYTIDRDGNSLILHVAATAAAPSAEAPSVAEAPPAAEPAPTVEGAPAPEAALAPELAAAPEAAQPSRGVVRVTGLGFKQVPAENKSRLIIGLSEPVADYQTREAGPNRIVVEIPRSRFEKEILKREFDTREFKTAILSVTPHANRATKSTEFTIELEQQVPYTVNLEGGQIVVDVDIPAQVARKQTATPMKDSVPPPAPPADAQADGEAASETPAEASPEGDVLDGDDTRPKLREEIVMDAEALSPEKKKDGRPKNYRYVKEAFMSDSTAVQGPLSAMGSILAGDYRGRKFTGRKISLDFKDADIRSIFRLIADISKLNLIVSDEVSGRITVRLENVPWDQAFAIILQSKGLWFEKYGNIVRIASADKLRQERELAAAAARASQAAAPMDVLFKPVSYATAGELIKQVRSVLSDRGSVDIDSRTNTLIIRDIRENLEKAKHMVEILDTQTPQVSIEARIVEARTTYTRSFGIIWGGQARFTPQTGNPTGVFFPNSATVQGATGASSFSGLPVALNYPSPLGVNAGVGIRLGSINNIMDLDLALGILETQGHAKLISSPKVTVLDNRQATIDTGQKIPFLTQTANAGSNVRFESATTSLSVTPHITNDGAVSMTINATRNAPNFAQLVQGNPLVDQNSASTEVLVKSGNTTVLGGVYTIRTGGAQSSLPYISKIPIIGWLFKNYSKELSRSELLIFVTPRIVGDEREAVRDIRG